MNEEVISLHPGAFVRELVEQLSSGEIMIAASWRRVLAFALDVLFVGGCMMLLTSGWIASAWNPSLLSVDTWWFMLLNWVVIFSSFWLYFKYTGRWMQRSLGQRFMHLAVIYGDATLMPEQEWGRRAVAKLRYIIPVLGLLVGVYDLIRIHRSETHQTSIDWRTNSIVVMDWSLPSEIRIHLR